MINYVIINGVNSNTKNGLGINELPPITKPSMRTQTEEIDGRDGDIITKLGYSAYDKTITIGLWGTGYDVNSIISFFTSEGTITFSNEPDKYYKFTMLEQIDVESLLRFKTASITFHCQPFKYPLEEEPLEIEYEYVNGEGESITLDNTEEDVKMSIQPKGNTSQTGTPTPTTPIPINVVSGDNEIVVYGKNLFDKNNPNNSNCFINSNNITKYDYHTQGHSIYIQVQPNTKYKVNKIGNFTDLATSENLPAQNGAITNRVLISGDNAIIQTGANDNYLLVFYYWGEVGQAYLDTLLANLVIYECVTYPIYLGVENLFDKKGDIYYSWTGVDVTYDSDNQEYTFNGTLLTPGNATLSKGDLGISEGEEITLSVFHTGGNVTIPSGTGGIYAYSIFSQDNTIYIRGRTDYPEFFEKYTFTGNMIAKSGGDSDYVYLQLWRVGTTFDNYKIKIQIEKGSKSNSFTPYGTTPIELNKIGDYQDYFYKTDKWYLHKETEKVVFNGTENWSYTGNPSVFYINTITDYATSNNIPYCNYYKGVTNVNGSGGMTTNNTVGFMTVSGLVTPRFYIRDERYTTDDTALENWLSTHNLDVYYLLATPTNTEITDTTLKGQLDNIQNAISYEGQTNVSQVNNDKPFIIDAKALEQGSDEVVVNNIGNATSKPLIALEGTGNINIYLDGTQVLQANVEDKMNIDIDKLEAYNPDTSALLNRQVTGNYNSMTLPSGNSTIKIDGNLTSATITNYTRWL